MSSPERPLHVSQPVLPGAFYDANKRLLQGYAIDRGFTVIRDEAIGIDGDAKTGTLRVSIADISTAVTRLDISPAIQSEKVLSTHEKYLFARRELSLSDVHPRSVLTIALPLGTEDPSRATPSFSLDNLIATTLTFGRAEQLVRRNHPAHRELKQLHDLSFRLSVIMNQVFNHQAEAREPSLISGPAMVQRAIFAATRSTAAYMADHNIPTLYNVIYNQGNAVRYTLDPEHHEEGETAPFLRITSPIRRSGDAINLMNLLSHLRGKAPMFDTNAIEQVAERLNDEQKLLQLDGPDKKVLYQKRPRVVNFKRIAPRPVVREFPAARRETVNPSPVEQLASWAAKRQLVKPSYSFAQSEAESGVIVCNLTFTDRAGTEFVVSGEAQNSRVARQVAARAALRHICTQ